MPAMLTEFLFSGNQKTVVIKRKYFGGRFFLGNLFGFLMLVSVK